MAVKTPDLDLNSRDPSDLLLVLVSNSAIVYDQALDAITVARAAADVCRELLLLVEQHKLLSPTEIAEQRGALDEDVGGLVARARCNRRWPETKVSSMFIGCV